MTNRLENLGTFGPGRNILGLIHLKDVASAVSLVLKGALSGNALGEGDKGFCESICFWIRYVRVDFFIPLDFVSSKYMMSAAEFSGIIGDASRKLRHFVFARIIDVFILDTL